MNTTTNSGTEPVPAPATTSPPSTAAAAVAEAVVTLHHHSNNCNEQQQTLQQQYPTSIVSPGAFSMATPMMTIPLLQSVQLRDILRPHPHDVLCGRGGDIFSFVCLFYFVDSLCVHMLVLYVLPCEYLAGKKSISRPSLHCFVFEKKLIPCHNAF
jgi:hypothetical protein